MKFCKKCKVSVRDDSKICPLCQHSLIDDDGAEDIVFPYIPVKISKKTLYTKLGIFVTVVICVISVILDMIIETGTHWSLYVLGGVASSWILLAVSLPRLRNIPKIIVHQAVVCALLVYIWDRCTGSFGWSVNYAVPFICAGSNIALIAVFFAMKLRIDDVAFYYMVNLLYGLLPIWFIFSDKAKILYPSLISVGVSIISLAAFILFYGPNIKTMLESKFHV